MAELDRPLQIDVEPDLLGRIVVRVHGALDLPEVGELRAVLENVVSVEGADVVLDLTEVGFLGSSGMGIIAGLHQDLAATDRRLSLRGASPMICKAFAITGLDRRIHMEAPGEAAGALPASPEVPMEPA